MCNACESTGSDQLSTCEAAINNRKSARGNDDSYVFKSRRIRQVLDISIGVLRRKYDWDQLWHVDQHIVQQRPEKAFLRSLNPRPSPPEEECTLMQRGTIGPEL